MTAPIRLPIPADVRVDFTGPAEHAPAGLVLVASPAAVEALIGGLVAAHPDGLLVVADLLDGQLTRAEARMRRTLEAHGFPPLPPAGDPLAVA